MKRILLAAVVVLVSLVATAKDKQQELVWTLPDIGFETTTCTTTVQIQGDDGKVMAVFCVAEDGTVKVGLGKTILTEAEMRLLVEWFDRVRGVNAPKISTYPFGSYGGTITLN